MSGQNERPYPRRLPDLRPTSQHGFLASAEDEKAKAQLTLANKPPVDHHGLVSAQWDLRMPGWQTPKPAPPKMSPEEEALIIASSKRLSQAAMLGGQTSLALERDRRRHG